MRFAEIWQNLHWNCNYLLSTEVKEVQENVAASLHHTAVRCCTAESPVRNVSLCALVVRRIPRSVAYLSDVRQVCAGQIPSISLPYSSQLTSVARAKQRWQDFQAYNMRPRRLVQR